MCILNFSFFTITKNPIGVNNSNEMWFLEGDATLLAHEKMRDLFDRIYKNKGPLGMWASQAEGYFVFPKFIVRCLVDKVFGFH